MSIFYTDNKISYTEEEYDISLNIGLDKTLKSYLVKPDFDTNDAIINSQYEINRTTTSKTKNIVTDVNQLINISKDYILGEGITIGDFATIKTDGKAYKSDVLTGDSFNIEDTDSDTSTGVGTKYSKKVVALTNNSFIAINSNATNGYGLYGSISNNIISLGTTKTISTTNDILDGVRISDTQALFTYVDPSQFRYTFGTISSGDVVFSSTGVIDSGNSYSGKICLLDTNKVAAIYRDGSTPCNINIKIGTISGTSISWGSANTVSNTHSIYDLDICALSSTKIAIILAEYNGISPALTTRIGTVDGTTVTIGDSTTEARLYSTYTVKSCNIEKISSTKFLATFVNNNSWYEFFYSTIVDVSGTTMTTHTVYPIKDSGGSLVIMDSFDVKVIDENYILYQYYNSTSSSMIFDLYSYSGSTLTLSNTTAGNGSSAISFDMLSNTSLITIYSDSTPDFAFDLLIGSKYSSFMLAKASGSIGDTKSFLISGDAEIAGIQTATGIEIGNSYNDKYEQSTVNKDITCTDVDTIHLKPYWDR